MTSHKTLLATSLACLLSACAIAPKGNYITAPSIPAPDGVSGAWLASAGGSLGDAIYNLYITQSGKYMICGDFLGQATVGSSGKLTQHDGQLSTIQSSGYMSDIQINGKTLAFKDYMTFTKADEPTPNCYKIFKDRGLL